MAETYLWLNGELLTADNARIDPADRGFLKADPHDLADLEILSDEGGHLARREPLGLPVLDVAQAV